MNDTQILLLTLSVTFVLAGLVKGVTGMGLPTVAMGLLGSVMPPADAAVMLIIPSLVTNIWQLFSASAIGPLWRRLRTMMLGIVLGTVSGAALLTRVDPRWSGLALGSALIGYGSYALLSPSVTVKSAVEPWLSPVIGLITGVITGATGVFVIPAVPYLQALKLDKNALVQALGLSFTVSTLSLAGGLFSQRAFAGELLALSALALVPALAGMALGQRIRERISPRRFRQCFLLFLLLLGLELVLKAVF
ncbi:hypothetical protein BTJ39_22175 [Izhakiella australiensis]|uniref:Probable membrane transporter protein n=1 Tax=Izhakiella australiensis TaxID=1926881 RepID=A0A1S8YA64_9GAMM|nr:sulfite exporter TauE/SafE family protein [Izhakiella australiensis]OON35678.1 hypothetical protein BTJ39_22175 [Izhakiella australiensis]